MYNHRGKAGFKRDWLGRKTEHYIRSEVLNKLVLDIIKEVSEYVKFNEEEFIKKVYSTSKEQQEKTSKLLKKRSIFRNILFVFFKKIGRAHV